MSSAPQVVSYTANVLKLPFPSATLKENNLKKISTLRYKVLKNYHIFAVESNFKIQYKMKKVVNAGIGGRSFVVDEDAYERLDTYLSHYRSKLPGAENEAMDDLEMRIADLFEEEIKSSSQVVTLALVERVIGQLGMPDGSQETEGSSYSFSDRKGDRPVRKFFRDPDTKKIAGVCGGIAAYFDIDVALIRALFLVLLFLGTGGFWIYLIIWIVAPLAETPAQKCEMHGIPSTAENMDSFTRNK